MYSKAHFAISAALGLAIAVWVDADPTRGSLVVAYSALIGTAIDLDHFVIARLRTGDWSNLRFVISNPRAALLEQDRIFEVGEVGARTRLVSHAVVGGLLVGVVAVVDPLLGVVSGIVLGVHVACDIVYDATRGGSGSQRT